MRAKKREETDAVPGAESPRNFLVPYARVLELERCEQEVIRLRAALLSLRPYFGTLVPDKKAIGTSHWQAARDAFALL